MFTRRSTRISLAPLALAAALCGVSGCGLGPGDHVFYRVAADLATQDAGCFQNNMIPDSVASDKSTLDGSATLILYITGDKVAELDTGAAVVEGAKTDTGYKFTGQTVDVEFPFGSNQTKTTQTTMLTIDLHIDGSTVTGTSVTVISNKCEGAMCPPDFNTRSCTQTSKFKGVEIDDAEVVVGAANAQKP